MYPYSIQGYANPPAGTAENEVDRDDAWKKAAAELEEQRRAKADLAKQHDGKSLYEILQANKDKKQAEFEEKARFKLHNALDDDEADYLDSVLEKKRKEEASVRKETLEQLDLFRRQREEAERKAMEEDSTEPTKGDSGQWAAVSRKRKKAQDSSLLKGVKLRKVSSAAEERKVIDKARDENEPAHKATINSPTMMTDKTARDSEPAATTKPPSVSSPAKPLNALSLGLEYASSDDDD